MTRRQRWSIITDPCVLQYSTSSRLRAKGRPQTMQADKAPESTTDGYDRWLRQTRTMAERQGQCVWKDTRSQRRGHDERGGL